MKDLFFTDLDGTLLNDSGRLTNESAIILNKLIENGVNFSVATARTFATVLEMFEKVSLKLPIVLMNGVMVYDPVKNEPIICHEIDNTSAEAVLDLYIKHGRYPMFYYSEGNIIEIAYSDLNNPHQQAYINKRTKTDSKIFFYTPRPVIDKSKKLIYIVTLDKYENLVDIYSEAKKIKGLTVSFYSDNYTDCYFLEIYSENASKALSAEFVKKYISADRIISFGDNLNDIPLFQASDECYAVSNAREELKIIATETIGSNNDNSVAKYIDYYVNKQK